MTIHLQRDAARTRAALLDAALRVITAHGASASLDAIAREAGVSKGGLLHHFRSKEALLVGLLEEWMTRFDAAVQAHLDPDDDRPGRLCRARIRAAFDADLRLDDAQWSSPAMLGALLGTPEVLARVVESDTRWRGELSADGLHPQRAAAIAYLLDGFTFAEVLGPAPDAAERAMVRDLLMALSEETGPLASS